MHSVSFSQARGQLTEIANHVKFQHEIWVFTKNNKPCVAMIPIAALEILQEAIEAKEDDEDLQALLASRGESGRSLEDILKELRV